MNKILLNSLGMAGLLTLLVLIYIGIAVLDLARKRTENEARHQCALSSRYEVLDGNATVFYPVKDLYEDCLAEKGIQ